MPIISVALVSIAIIVLGASLVFAHKICHITQNKGWRLLSGLILGFVIGYGFFLDAILILKESVPIFLGVSVILFFGSVFVFVVVRYSLASITALNTMAEEEHYLALHDSLTGLPNRKFCFDEIAKRIEYQQPFSVLLFDVVNFKQVNDALGHQCGDKLLVQIAQRLSKLLKANEVITRLGGDEFVVITPRTSDFEVNQLVSYMKLALKELFIVDQYEISSSVVFGSSQYPTDASTTPDLLDFADISMYQAKKQGKDIVRYLPQMLEGAKLQLSISSQIQQALENDRFCLYYQPIVNAKDGYITEYEALIRWETEDGSFIPPAQFIPIAEQSNKISDITTWVLNQVIRDIDQFSLHGINIPIHINLSAKDIIGGKVFKLLAETSAKDPKITQSIIIEITESAAISDIPDSQKRLERIKQLGYRISLDDFGTGYSSLSRLSELPIDQIKIDRSFIRDILINNKNRTIVEAAIRLAHGLNFSVVVEGVEDSETLHCLEEMQCDLIQGYYYSAPQPLLKMVDWTHRYHNNSPLKRFHQAYRS